MGRPGSIRSFPHHYNACPSSRLFEGYELIPALNLWDRVVGISRFAYTNDLLRQAMPQLPQWIPSAGSARNVNMEVLLRQRPELVVTWSPRRDTVTFMENRGMRVLSLAPEGVDETVALVATFGHLFGRERESDATIRAMQGIFNLVKARSQHVPAEKQRKVLWLGVRPTTCAAGGDPGQVIRLVGARNVGEQIVGSYADIPIETLIAWDPDVIVLWGYAPYGVEHIVRDPRWQSVRAVRERRVYQAPALSLWSPRLALFSLWMARHIYPERYEDLDVRALEQSFYRRVFHLLPGGA